MLFNAEQRNRPYVITKPYIITLDIHFELMKQVSVVQALMTKSFVFLADLKVTSPSRKTKLVCISLYCTTGPNKRLKLVCN